MHLDEPLPTNGCEKLLHRPLNVRFCPVCAIIQDRTYNLLCELQLEAIRNKEINARVLAAGGYCHFHFWYLEHLASAATNAQLLDDLLSKIDKERLEGILLGIGGLFADASRCPVCRCCVGWEQRLLDCFVEKLSHDEFRAVYEDSRGLCLPHLAKLSPRLTDQQQRTYLLNSSRRQLRALIQELKRLVAKRDNRDHSPGAENDSAFRAVEKLVGGKHYRVG